MYDKSLVIEIFSQIKNAIQKINNRFKVVGKYEDFLDTPEGQEKLDAICMQLIALGESLKNVDKITQGNLLNNYPQIDWKGAKSIRDIITHHYFDIDAEIIYDVCKNKLNPLFEAIKKIQSDLQA